MKPEAPCKGCTERRRCCWSECEEYIAFQRENERYRLCQLPGKIVKAYGYAQEGKVQKKLRQLKKKNIRRGKA